MKIIHTADLHLDSRLSAHLDSVKAAERRTELLGNFSRLVSYAKENGVEAILISGDLFDTARVSARARDAVLGEIKANPSILFFYIRGNHDSENALTESENLITFSDEWESCRIQGTRIVITGMELSKDNIESRYNSLELSMTDMNIVMLHGQIADHGTAGKEDIIDLSKLSYKNIDYLALGHVHKYSEGLLPVRGEWVYPGCLEGRGMDEPGKHGFVLMNIDEETNIRTREFVAFAARDVYELQVDITGSENVVDIRTRIEACCEETGVQAKDYLNVILEGTVSAELDFSTQQLRSMLDDDFYALRVEDKTRVSVNYSDYRHDATLKGEFVRLVESETDIADEEKAQIIRMGIRLLSEEDIDI